MLHLPNHTSYLLLLTTFCLVWSCGGDTDVKPRAVAKPVPVDTALASRADSVVANLHHVGTLGVVMYDATAGRTLYEHCADSVLAPASCQKLLTVIAAVRRFGVHYEYRTRLYADGKMSGDTLVGNVTLRTQFDPFFNADSLRLLVRALRDSGVRRVRGRIVLDMADQQPMNHEAHWTIGDLPTGRVGLPFGGAKRLRRDTQYAFAAAGIRYDDIALGRLNLKAAPRLVAETRTPMHAATERALKNSSNINAEALLYPLGYVIAPRSDHRASGVRALQRFIRTELRYTGPLTLHDGCGLCPQNRVTPRLLTTALYYAYQHRYIYDEILPSLPLSGTDGTLHDRLRRPAVRGLVRAKTGTLTRDDGISSLAGYYVNPKDKHQIIFVIINNRCPVADGRWWQDKFITAMLEKKS